ncbi:MAG: hypothetical protein AAF236_04550, partial [Verrucomicrobiota bacterium]
LIPLAILLLSSSHHLFSQELTPTDEVYEYVPGEVDWLTGEGFVIGGIVDPRFFVIGVGGVVESGSEVSDFANGDHDPIKDLGFQAIEIALPFNFNNGVTGLVNGTGLEREDEWEAILEEAFIHVELTDTLSVGGGLFFNTFGRQNHQHIHAWDFVNQDLVNARILNEGELTTLGGELIAKTPGNMGVLTVAFGGVRTHGHGHDEEEEEHGHEEEEEHHEEEEEEEHHLEIDDSGFNDWVFSADYKFRPFVDDTIIVSTSVATGENGFGRDTHAFGAGIQKVFNGHDHGNGPEFCDGATLIGTEFIGRHVDYFDEEHGGESSFNDYGLSTRFLYGLDDRSTIGLRHDWIGNISAGELNVAEAHRLSAAYTIFLDPKKHLRAKIQYDYTDRADLNGEHAAYFQLQYQWGGIGGIHNH